MQIEERSYSGRIFRPTPEVHLEADGSLGIIATPWGSRQGAKRAIETLIDYALSVRQDLEVTSAFHKLTCLSPLANSLRASLMLVNDSLYREENKNEYTTGVEVLAFARSGPELAFAQVGSPQLFLAREGLPWIPLSVQIDMSTELSRPPNLLPPLPQNMLGLHSSTNMNVSSFRMEADDRIICLSHSLVSHPLFSLAFTDANIDAISRKLSQEYPDLPFWLGIVAR